MAMMVRNDEHMGPWCAGDGGFRRDPRKGKRPSRRQMNLRKELDSEGIEGTGRDRQMEMETA